MEWEVDMIDSEKTERIAWPSIFYICTFRLHLWPRTLRARLLLRPSPNSRKVVVDDVEASSDLFCSPSDVNVSAQGEVTERLGVEQAC